MTMSRLVLAVLTMSVCTVFAGCERQKEPKTGVADPPAAEGTLVAVGDSLTAGYGVPESEAYPARLEKKLNQAGYRWRVINAGISGETSSGALSRIEWILKLKPDIVILETGANDGLRGIDPKLTRHNIDLMVTQLQAKGVLVVLAGMKMFKSLGEGYASQFDAVYPEVAKKHDLILIPFFLSKVAGDPALNQADTIHPLSDGYRVVAETVHPYVVRAIEKKRAGKGRQ
jgi:acyl-CoA thioesterase-1